MRIAFRLTVAFAMLYLVLSAALKADALSYATAGNVAAATSTFGILDLTTGSYSQIATASVFVGDLAMAPNGNIYALTFPFMGTGTGEFATIDPTTGVITDIAADTADIDTIGFSGNGLLYGITYAPTGPQAIYSITPATGATSFIADLSAPPPMMQPSFDS